MEPHVATHTSAVKKEQAQPRVAKQKSAILSKLNQVWLHQNQLLSKIKHM